MPKETDLTASFEEVRAALHKRYNSKKAWAALIQPTTDADAPKKQVGVPYAINQRLKSFTALIERYQPTSDTAISSLQAILAAIRDIDETFSNRELGRDQFYQRVIKDQLFLAIKETLAGLGTSPADTQQIAPKTLESLLANMSQKKALRFMKILEASQGFNIKALKQLYDDEDSNEAKAYQEFWAEHKINCISAGNSKNYTVTSHQEKTTQVLVLEDPMGATKAGPRKLRENEETLQLLNPRTLERAVDSYFLVVTEFLPLSSLANYRYQHHTTPELLSDTAEFMWQMASKFIVLKQAGCLFTDAKNDNWFPKSAGQDGGRPQLCLSDLKSLRPFAAGTDAFQRNQGEDEFTPEGCLHTTSGFHFMSELDNEVEVDKAHAMLLGKNIYDYLTGEPLRFKRVDKDGEFIYAEPKAVGQEPKHVYQDYYDCKNEAIFANHAIFSTPIGKHYRYLIEGLVKRAPEDRMPLVNAQQYLRLINALKAPPFESINEAVLSLFRMAYQPEKPASIDEPNVFFDKLDAIAKDERLAQLLSALAPIQMEAQDTLPPADFRQKMTKLYIDAETEAEKQSIIQACVDCKALCKRAKTQAEEMPHSPAIGIRANIRKQITALAKANHDLASFSNDCKIFTRFIDAIHQLKALIIVEDNKQERAPSKDGASGDKAQDSMTLGDYTALKQWQFMKETATPENRAEIVETLEDDVKAMKAPLAVFVNIV